MYALQFPTDAFDPSGLVIVGGVRTSWVQNASVNSRTADNAIKIVRKPYGSEENMVVLPRAGMATMQRALADLRRYRNHSNNADAKSFDFAEKFLGLIANNSKPFRVSAQVFSEGTAVLNLNSFDAVAQFEFLGDGTIVANIDSQGEWDEDVPGFDGSHIPTEIAKELGIVVRR